MSSGGSPPLHRKKAKKLLNAINLGVIAMPKWAYKYTLPENFTGRKKIYVPKEDKGDTNRYVTVKHEPRAGTRSEYFVDLYMENPGGHADYSVRKTRIFQTKKGADTYIRKLLLSPDEKAVRTRKYLDSIPKNDPWKPISYSESAKNPEIVDDLWRIQRVSGGPNHFEVWIHNKSTDHILGHKTYKTKRGAENYIKKQITRLQTSRQRWDKNYRVPPKKDRDRVKWTNTRRYDERPVTDRTFFKTRRNKLW